MNYLKKLGKAFLTTFITLIIGIVIITLLNYFNIIGINITNISKIIILGLSIFIGSFSLGKMSVKKGYLEGFKFGLLITFILFFLNLIITKNIKIRLIILYIIINITSILGSMFGILKSKTFDK
ncbi:MAG: TIGR04086 family membrane protein [Bacilli bacterium]|nr:TIGR04086 family membrane protein [Bacilli bacterium]